MQPWPSVPILITSELEAALTHNNIPVEAYKPAYESAGLDLYCTEHKTIAPHHKELIATGLKTAIPHGWVGLLMERGSVWKWSLQLQAGVIDPGFSGEVFAMLYNTSSNPVEIHFGQKLPVQMVVVPATNTYTQVSAQEFETLHQASTRQAAQIGSSDAPKS